VDALGFLIGNGSSVVQWSCNGFRNQRWYPDNHAQEKRRLTERWYQFYEDSNNYGTWMTLSGHRHYGSGMQSLWSGPIGNALAAYNSAGQAGGTHTLYFGDYAPAIWHDVHIWATADRCATDLSVPQYRCTGAGASGRVVFFDEGYHECVNGLCDGDHSRRHTWWYAMVLLNNSDPENSDDWSRTSTVSHELGHVAGLRHDNSPEGEAVQDYDCGGRQPRTIQDYDCYYDPEIINVPQAWDSCGINHSYYDVTWGFAGC